MRAIMIQPVVCDRCGHVKDAVWWKTGLCNECFLGGRVAPLIPVTHVA